MLVDNNNVVNTNYYYTAIVYYATGVALNYRPAPGGNVPITAPYCVKILTISR